MKYVNCGKLNYSNGFTLAEVLITLVIIGIIAAITIPAVINTYVESSTVSKVKKGLSVLGQAKMLAEAQNGPIQDWNFREGLSAAGAAQLWSYLRPHLQVVKDCGTNTGCYQTNATYLLSGASSGYNHGAHNSYYKFVLSDGGVMWFRTASSGKCSVRELNVDNFCAVFFYDINGDKEPNTEGRDIFLYVISTEGVYPPPIDDCNRRSVGHGCAAYIVKNSNMNYLH